MRSIAEKNVGNRFYILNKVVSVSLIFVSCKFIKSTSTFVPTVIVSQ